MPRLGASFLLAYSIGCAAPRPAPPPPAPAQSVAPPAEPAPPPPLGEAFALSIAPLKEAYSAGEPVDLRVVLSNKSPQKVTVYRPSAAMIRISARDEAGRSASCKPPRGSRKVDPARFITVPPGGSVDRLVDAGRRCALGPGKWMVRAEVQLGPELDGSAIGFWAATGLAVGEETVLVGAPPKIGLALRARVKERETKPSAPALIELSLWNLSDLPRPLAPPSPVRLFGTGPDEKPLDCRAERVGEGVQAWVAPRAAARRTLDVASLCRLPLPGEYRVRAEIDGADGRPLTSGWVRFSRTPPEPKWAMQLLARLRPGAPPGRPVIDARLVNGAAHEATVFAFTPRFLLARVHEEGGPELSCDRAPPPPDPGLDPRRFLDLPPGASVGGSVDLGRRCGTLPPGRYRVQVAYDLPERFSGSEVGIRAWTGRAAADELLLVVPEPPDLALSAAPLVPAWVAGEEAELVVQVRNRGARPVVLWGPEPAFLALWMSGPEGRARCAPVAAPPAGRARPEDWLILQPGGSRELRVSLAGCGRLRPGRHEVQVEYAPPPILGQAAWSVPPDSSSDPVPSAIFSGTLRARPAAFEVLPVPAKGTLALRLAKKEGPAVIGRPVLLSARATSVGLVPVVAPASLADGLEFQVEGGRRKLDCSRPAAGPARALSGGESVTGEVDLAARCALEPGVWAVRIRYGEAVSPPVTIEVDDPVGVPSLSLSGRSLGGRPALVGLELVNRGAPVWLPAPLADRLVVEATTALGQLQCDPDKPSPGAEYVRVGHGEAVRLLAAAGGACAALPQGEARLSVRLRIPAAADGRTRGLPSYAGEISAEVPVKLPAGPPAPPSLRLAAASLAPAYAGHPAPALLALTNTGATPVPLGRIQVSLSAEDAYGKPAACNKQAAALEEGRVLLPGESWLWPVDLARTCTLAKAGWYSLSPHLVARGAPASGRWIGSLAGPPTFAEVGPADTAPPVTSRVGLLADAFSRTPPVEAQPDLLPALDAGSDARLVTDQLRACIDAWLQEQRLNEFGDPPGTTYTGGSPLVDPRTGEAMDRHLYLLEKFPRLRRCGR